MNQLAPNLFKWYRAIRSCVSSIMGVIGPEQLELFALEFEKFNCSVYKYQPISSKVGQNIYDSY